MKYVLTFIAGVAMGIICLYAWQEYQFQRISMDAPILEVTPDHFELKSFEVTYGKPLPSGNVGYVWQSNSNDQNNGRGELFEKYEVVKKTSTGNHVKDAGSSLRMYISGHSLEWSSGSESSGYIYYNPNIMTIAHQSNN